MSLFYRSEMLGGCLDGRALFAPVSRTALPATLPHVPEREPPARKAGERPPVSGGEQLAQGTEALEFERIAGGIAEEHGRLLADFALETNSRLDQEVDIGGNKPFGKPVPVVPIQDDAEMPGGHRVTIDRVRSVAPGMIIDKV